MKPISVSKLLLISMITLGLRVPAIYAETDVEAKTVLSNSPWLSTRGPAMGEALSGLADSSDAPYYNPAGIGNIHQDSKAPFLRLLTFPYLGLSLNENSVALRKEFMKNQGETEPMMSEAMLDAQQGKRQYARASFMPAIGLGRFIFNYAYDVQVAAVSRGNGSEYIDTHHRTTSGPGAGISIADFGGRFYIGAYTALLTREETKAQAVFSQIMNPHERKAMINDNKKTYSGQSINAGMIWVLAKVARPTISLVGRNVGKTTYKSSNEFYEPIVDDEELVSAFSLSPKLGKWGHLNYTIEVGEIANPDLALEKKMRTGIELTTGKLFGSLSAAGVRAGYNNAGISSGLHLNIGLIGLSLASSAVDIGANNKKLIERRNAAIVNINLGEY